jgi:hypothetical protein
MSGLSSTYEIEQKISYKRMLTRCVSGRTMELLEGAPVASQYASVMEHLAVLPMK